MFDVLPIDRLCPTDDWWRLSGGAAGSPAATGLVRPNSVTGGGFWLCDLTIPVYSPSQIKLARAVVDAFDFGTVPVIVPSLEADFAPYPLSIPLRDTTFSDGAVFADGALFRSGGIDATVAADAELRATRVSLAFTAAAPLQGGERFSLEHAVAARRLYEIVRVFDQLVIRPPLREAVTAYVGEVATLADFNRPGCIMRCTNCETALATLSFGKDTTLTLQFQEAFPDADGNY